MKGTGGANFGSMSGASDCRAAARTHQTGAIAGQRSTAVDADEREKNWRWSVLRLKKTRAIPQCYKVPAPWPKLGSAPCNQAACSPLRHARGLDFGAISM